MNTNTTSAQEALSPLSSPSEAFDFSRYSMLLRRYLVENRRSLLSFWGVMLGVMLLISHLVTPSLSHMILENPENLALVLVSAEMSAFAPLYAIFSCLSGSAMFSSLSTRPGRIHTLMAPGSMLEKFAVRLTVYLPMFIVAFIISALVADTFRAITTHTASILAVGSPMAADTFGLTLSLTLLLQALYALGSSLWPRRSFIKSFLALFLLMFLMLNFLCDMSLLHWLNSIHITVTGVIAILLAATVGIYFLAWLRFSRAEVVKRFMM